MRPGPRDFKVSAPTVEDRAELTHGWSSENESGSSSDHTRRIHCPNRNKGLKVAAWSGSAAEN